ncbi:MAG: T9SS type A sorting domain-containing protein [Bacteroidales bacterium]|jgi:hypothetical protein|nr:T9SS type A sorting domain-containing protein [Bacteroidales bacterium]
MKKIIPFLVICFFGGNAFGQEISSQVVASAGEYSETSNYSVSWTLGEIAIETLESSSIILTQGFQQGYFEITSVDEIPATNLSLNVYPNPAIDYIYISLESDERKTLMIEIVDEDGRVMVKEQWNNPGDPYKISLTGLNSSLYFLRVYESTGKPIQTFKIIKR